MHTVTTSYASPAMRPLDGAVRTAGVVVMNGVWQDLGIDYFYAIKTISGFMRGGKIGQFCGGLPAPECASDPLGYKFAWSSSSPCSTTRPTSPHTKRASSPGSQPMAAAQPYFVSPAEVSVAYPNRDSTPFWG